MLSSPEQAFVTVRQLRGGLAPRRRASRPALSSGQHSPAGGEQITGSPPPARSPLSGGKPQLRLGLSSPELVLVRVRQLRRGIAPRSRASLSALSSGQHSPAGGEQITGSPPPVRRTLTGETQPQTCSLTKSEPNNRLILLFYAAQLVIMTSNKRVSIRF